MNEEIDTYYLLSNSRVQCTNRDDGLPIHQSSSGTHMYYYYYYCIIKATNLGEMHILVKKTVISYNLPRKYNSSV